MDGAISKVAAVGAARMFEAKNNERLELSRVQDARAALPQNCSPMKIRRLQNAAYGTIGL